jgi:L-threonylcarbamoyladenylate synthase
MTDILDGHDPTAIERAAGLLRQGDLVVFPTETVYGLGADAANPLAVAKIFELKKRPRFDPLIVHIAEKAWLQWLVLRIPPAAQELIERFWPGPLTIILEKGETVPDIVTAGLPTVAIRMPSHPVALELIRAFGTPVAAPSANPFGYVSPTRASHVAEMFKGKVPLILDGGAAAFGIESTIVSIRDGKVVAHRHGAVSIEELERVVGPIREKPAGGTPEAPGELPYRLAIPAFLPLGSPSPRRNPAFCASFPPGTTSGKRRLIFSHTS